MTRTLDEKKQAATQWFAELRDLICSEFEVIEQEGGAKALKSPPGKFKRKTWDRRDHTGADGGGGTMSIMHGRVFEKVGVNISTVYGEFSPEFRKEIPGKDLFHAVPSPLSISRHEVPSARVCKRPHRRCGDCALSPL